MKCKQSRPGFELVSLCPFPTTITITPRAPPPNPVYAYISNICTICKHMLSITFTKEPELLFCTQLNPPKYCYITVTSWHQPFFCTYSLFYLTHTEESIRCYQSRSKWTGSNANEWILHIFPMSKAGVSPSDVLRLFTGHLLEGVLTPL